MSWLDGLAQAVDGAFQTAAMVHAKSPVAQRAAQKRAAAIGEKCTPCAAGAYIANLAAFAGGGGYGGAHKRGGKR